MPRSRSSLIGGAPIPDYGLLDVPRRRRGKQRAVRGEEAELVADFHVAAPDQDTSLGRRDHALLRLAVLTGVRVTELVTLTIGDVNLTNGAHIKIKGKGRKRRATTLTPETVTVLRACLTERQGQPHAPLFPTRQGQPLTRSGVRQLLSKHTNTATTTCPSLNDKPVSPHTLRHTNAMLLRAGEIDITTIALRLGQHESIKTTYICQHADPALKQESHRPDRADRHQARQIPTIRRAPRVPLKASDSALRRSGSSEESAEFVRTAAVLHGPQRDGL